MFHRVPRKTSSPIEHAVLAANPLVASVLRENVSIQGNRAVIALWPHWTDLIGQAHEFGRVLSIARNPFAVLGRIGAYPEILSAPCGHCACSGNGAMEFSFACWHHAAVSVEEQPGGWLYAVEFFDSFGEVMHKLCLTSDSDFDVFRDWVELHQVAPGESTGYAFTRNLSRAGVPPEGEVIGVRSDGVRAVFDRLIREKLPLQCVVGNEGLVQGANMLPASVRESGQWIFVSDETCGLHLRVERLAEVCLHRVHWEGDSSNWVLKAYDPEGHLACALTPPRGGETPGWDDLITDTLQPFQTNESNS